MVGLLRGTLGFERNQYIRAFFETNLALYLTSKGPGNPIGYYTFKHGYALYAFDLIPSLLDGDQIEMAKAGPLTIELTFFRVLPDPMQGLIYAELDLVLEISKPDKR